MEGVRKQIYGINCFRYRGTVASRNVRAKVKILQKSPNPILDLGSVRAMGVTVEHFSLPTRSRRSLDHHYFTPDILGLEVYQLSTTDCSAGGASTVRRADGQGELVH